ncbi:hypothetical protein [Lentibacillus daqui]|uniref:hypothetical protein n=1 Tax=Lentibacillus daqui TaxID=2911514 RepID=UPI0022B12A58|nr:hypothetical protein [Lentibacillus daqui]
MWKKIKKALFNWFFLLLFSFLLLTVITVIASNIPKLFEENEVGLVEDAYTSKGLYFGPQYYVHLSNGNIQRIFKNDFLSLEKGDTFKTFFNQISLKDFLLASMITMLFLCLLFALVYMFASEIFGQMRWFKWMDERKEQFKNVIVAPFTRNKKQPDILKRVGMIIFILSLSMLLLLVVKNVVYKVVPFGKTNAAAELLKYEKERIANPKVPIVTYTLTYQYTDKDGTLYKTKKNVSSATYNRYKGKRFIPIMYRKNLPYDTFIENRSMGEFISPLFSVPTFIFACVGYLVFFLIKKYVEVWGIPFIRTD